nr:hypothetical protein [Tanacetum cinerariifolium]
MNSCAYDPNPNSFDCPPDSYHPPYLTYETYSGDTCGNDSQFGYDCPPQFRLNYEPELGYTQNYNSCPHDLLSFPQQYPCCDDCGVTHEPYQCQPENHDYYNEQNSYYDSNSLGFDQFQTPQYTVNHPIFNVHNDILTSQTTIMDQMTQLSSICEMFYQIVQKKQEVKRIEEEQAAKAQNSKIPVCYDDDDDYSAITPSEPVDSLSMRDEHLDTIPVTELDEFIKFCVENLVPNPSGSEGENGCDLPSCFTTFSNIFFDDDYEFDYVDNQSLHNEDFSDKIFSNPLFEEEIISIKKDTHHFNAEFDLVESMLNRIDKTDCHPENEICLSQRLLYDNSSPRPPEEFNSENSNAEIESFSPFPILNEDSDSFMEEINLFLTPDDPMQPSIEDDDDSEGDILFLERLLHDDPIPLPDTLDFSYEVRVFLPFFTYPVTSPVLLSSGSENTIFDLGITVNRFYSF